MTLPQGMAGPGYVTSVDTLGNPLGISSNPLVTEDQIRAYTIAGQSYNVTTGKVTSPAGGPIGFQLFNPASSGKNLLIYSLLVAYNSSNVHDIRWTSADSSSIVGWSNTPITPINNKGGGAASVATSGYSNVALTGGLLGASRETTGTQNNLPIETLTNGECIYLPASASINGVAVYLTIGAAALWSVTASYLEF